MPKCRIISNGDGKHTWILGEDGKPIPGIQNIEIHIPLWGPATAEVTMLVDLIHIAIDTENLTKIEMKCPEVADSLSDETLDKLARGNFLKE